MSFTQVYLRQLRSAIAQPKVGDKVLILYPAYVAGRVGVICGSESDQSSKRWLIRVEPENFVVSLPSKDFQVLS